ncbi:hypothetical protein [Ancylomarina sp. 16SWW S1-10-2]|uniref:hypothetical protein n=1 Tax=Ancylomarina sp. 16SWW S1-10-2 TaxID=2499681 RepID=UPI0012AE50D2|nr:hypothetical protein [Ancylomarina sp. 16SWW S1-10-2]MRT92428.1 hypothetical protein [Ancylomarina sp. 16SWW S1-10-2]
METLEVKEHQDRSELVLEIQAETYLLETRKWTKFFAILAFIFMGIGVLSSISMFMASSFITAYSPLPMTGIAVFYLIFTGVSFFPIYYLLQFSNKAKEALLYRNSQTLTEAMKYIKSHFKFVGIMTIVMLALYPIIIIMTIMFGASQSF